MTFEKVRLETTTKVPDLDVCSMQGSGHLDIGFDGPADVSLNTSSDDLRLVIETKDGAHHLHTSVVLNDEEAKQLGKDLVYQADGD